MEKLFGTDGIRGTAGEWPLVPDFIYKIGYALGTVLRQRSEPLSVVVGRDTRQSGPELQAAITRGLLASGVDVKDLGVMTTPGVAVLTRRMKAGAGVVLSASHNPFEQNGIKFFSSTGQKLSVETEDAIEGVAHSAGEFTPVAQPGKAIDCSDAHETYTLDLLAEHRTKFLAGLTLVVDCSNGAAFKFGPDVLRRAGAHVHEINCSPNGTNINNDAGSEHVRRNPAEMGALVRQHKADFAVSFDGDADRVVFCDAQGGLVDGDHMLGVLARLLNARGKLLAGTVVTTTMRNTGFKNYVEAAGIRMEETPVGDKYVIERLMELRNGPSVNGSIGLGGEQAGHIVLLDDDHFTGDGIRTALYFARAFREAGASSLTQFAAAVGKTPQIIASAPVGDLAKLSKQELADLEEKTLTQTSGLIRANLRYSGTEPLFRVMLESDGRQTLEALAGIAVGLCRKVQSAAEAGKGIDILNCTSGGVTVA